MRSIALPAAFALCFLPVAAIADEIEDALAAALEAYRAGDVSYALEELDFARAKLFEAKAASLSSFLPPAPDGWRLELDAEMGAAFGMMGGGSGASGVYTSGDGARSFTITLIADSPMIAGIGAMVANASAMGATVERVGRQKFAVQEGQMVGLVANRVLIQAEGAAPATMIPLLEQIDFRALAGWGL